MHGQDSTPSADAVARLDQAFNHHLLAATSDSEARAWWSLKVFAKRRLASMPDSDVELVAAKLLEELPERAEARA